MTERLFQQLKKEAELNKLELEKKKLSEEIRHLERPLILNPQYFSPIAAIIVGLLAFLYASYTGFWDTKKAILENQKLALQIDIEKFEKRKDSLAISISTYQKTNDSLSVANSTLKKKLELVSKRFNEISTKYEKEKKSIIQELDDIDNLLKNNKNAEAFSKLKQLVYKLNGITRGSFSDDFSDDFE